LPPAEDPRLTIATRYLNVKPSVKYVGDAACAGCHRKISDSFHQHPMGRSLAPVTAATPSERYDTEAHNPFEAFGFLYRVDRQADRVVHDVSAPGGPVRADAEIAYTVGSGQRGRSYLIDHDGYLFQSPLTWYPLKGIWALSPGYDATTHFGRPVTVTCLFCHANQVQADAHAANRFVQPIFRGHAIGCERCHGPGELHVQRNRAGGDDSGDWTIVNPRALDHDLREAVCQQCHLHGEVRVVPRGREYFDYRPGLPLDRFLADFVKAGAQRQEDKFVGTVEQMYASRCFAGSSGPGKLGCISCHDPHALPASEQRIAYYRDRCLKCHTPSSCKAPVPERLAKTPEDSCIVCHMPRREGSITHTAITDHAVPRHGDKGSGSAPVADWPVPGQMPLVPFPPTPSAAAADRERNLGVALMEVGRKESAAKGRLLAELALPLLEAAAAGDPQDATAWEAKATALVLLDRREEALQTCAASLAANPDREMTLFLATSLALQLQRPAEVRTYAERAIKINPWLWQFRQMLAEANAQEHQWTRAIDAARQAIQLQPANVQGRQLLVLSYLQLGDKLLAEAELRSCLSVMPPAQRDDFRRWVEKQLR
jgi:hypothetical protein